MLRNHSLGAVFPLLLLICQITYAQDEKPRINTPMGITQCVPVTLTVGGGTPPYSVSVLPGGQTTASPLQTFPTLEAPGPLVWNADLAPGTAITFQVRDSKGLINYSSQNTIAPGGNCAALSPFGAPATGSSLQASNSTGSPAPSPAPDADASNATSEAPAANASAPAPGNPANTSTTIPPAETAPNQVPPQGAANATSTPLHPPATPVTPSKPPTSNMTGSNPPTTSKNTTSSKDSSSKGNGNKSTSKKDPKADAKSAASSAFISGKLVGLSLMVSVAWLYI